jgi:anti-sigma regulatory factor (Ser/Thr protein kinase)
MDDMSPHAFRGSARENSSVPGHRHRSHRSGDWPRPAGAAADVRLTVPARPEYVAVIRHVLGALAEALRLPAGQVEDMRLAVTEACTNVVRHAYHDHEPGPIDVVIRPGGDRLELIVSDEGRGIGPSADVAGPGPPADRRPRRLRRDRPWSEPWQPAGDVVPVPTPVGRRVSGPEPATTVSIASGPFVGPILRRVVGMLAARADLPLDRLDDAVLVADLIAARAPAHSVDDMINVALDPGDRSLELRVGPLRQGGGQALIVDAAVPGVGNVIEQLADELSVTPDGETEFLHVRLAYNNGR